MKGAVQFLGNSYLASFYRNMHKSILAKYVNVAVITVQYSKVKNTLMCPVYSARNAINTERNVNVMFTLDKIK